jgi:hypothetical protein
LTDDVALLTCEQGDCPLIENSFIDSKEWPRATVNDKPFLTEFPYLAEPWPSTPPAAAAASIGVSGALAAVWDIALFSAGLIDMICTPIMMLLVVVVIIVVIVVIVIWLFVRWRRKRATA